MICCGTEKIACKFKLWHSRFLKFYAFLQVFLVFSLFIFLSFIKLFFQGWCVYWKSSFSTYTGFFEKFLTYTLSTQKFKICLWKTQFQHRNKHAFSPYFVLFNVNWKPFRCPFVRLNSQITIKIILQYFLTSRSRKFLKWDCFETFFIIFWTWLPKISSFSMENTVFHGMS